MFRLQILLVIASHHPCDAISSVSLTPDPEIVSQPLISEDVRDQLETRLMDTCGSQCVDFFQQVYPLISNVSLNDSKSVNDQFSRFNHFFDSFLADGESLNVKLLNEIQNVSRTVVSSFASNETGPPPQPGMPCRTQAECNALDFSINRCSHMRKSAMDAYEKANTAVTVMAQIVATMCGCVFVGPVRLCILAPIPFVCGFPFEAYRGLFGLSMALWSAVVATTSACSSVGVDITSLVKIS